MCFLLPVGWVFQPDRLTLGMRTVAFDGRMGASGDMICGALIGLGADPAYSIRSNQHSTCSISSTRR